MPVTDAESRVEVVLTRYRVAMLAAIVGVCASIAAYLLVAKLDRALAEAAFENDAQVQAGIIQQGLQNYPNAIYALSLYFSVTPDVSFQQFSAFAGDLEAKNSGISAFSWAPKVASADRGTFEAQARATVRPDYQIKDEALSGSPTRAGDRDQYFPILYTVGLRPSVVDLLTGFDEASVPIRKDAIELAQDRDELVAVGPVVTMREGSGQVIAYTIFAPVYQWQQPHDTVEQRRANIAGYIVGIVRIEDALHQVLTSPGATKNFGFYLYDPGNGASAQPLYWHAAPNDRAHPTAPSLSDLLAGPHLAATLDVSTSKLGLIIVPPGQLGGGLQDIPALTVLAAGLTITTLVAFYALMSARRRRQLERLAEELGTASRDLSLSNTLLTAASETSPDGILALDSNRKMTLVNRPFIEMMKVPAELTRDGDDTRLIEWIQGQVKDEDRFAEKVADIAAHPDKALHDQLALKDGRVFDREARPLVASDGRNLGRILYFRDITARAQAAQALEYRGTLLHAVAAAAADLLETTDLAASVPKALEIVGKAARAHRVLVIEVLEPKPDRPPFVLRFAWNSPQTPVHVEQNLLNEGIDFSDPTFQSFFAPLSEGKPVMATRSEPDGARQLLERLQIASLVVVPLMVEGKFWGHIGFDDCSVERHWDAPEVDILATLADLVGAAIARARYVDELTAADTIVEHSPVILYRLGAKPPFPMTYVSRNVDHLGYAAADFLRSPSHFMKLFDAKDFAQVGGHLAKLSQHWEAQAPGLWHLRRADGSYCWYENQLHPIFDAGGTLAAIEGVAIDVDARVNVEIELRHYNVLLDAVTQSVATLLTQSSVAEAVPIALAHLGKVMGEHRILVFQRSGELDANPFPRLRFHWSKTNESVRTFDQIVSRDAAPDLASAFAPLGEGKTVVVTPETAQQTLKEIMRATGTTSFLWVPIFGDKAWWGHVSIESHNENRIWNDSEIALFRTLANLIGAAMARDARTQALADASRIVENSSTILFRGLPQQPMPLVYISQNLRRYGYEAASFLKSPLLYGNYIHPDDRPQLAEAQRRAASENAEPGTVEFRFKAADGDYRWIESRYNPIRDSSGAVIEIEGILVDITERKNGEETIAALARTDALTNLANRRTFLERLDQLVATTKRGASPFAVLSLDLDHFKEINDTLGHPTGDLLLQAVGERLRKLVRETDLVARFGGDEFMLLQSDVDDPAAAGALAEKIRAVIAAPVQINGNSLRVTASIGIATFSPEIGDAEALIEQADVALYRAKEEGRDRYRFHSDEMNADVRERMVLVEELREGLTRREFELDYQPLVELASGRIVGMEALVRWKHPRRGRLLPAAFLPAAERAGLMPALGRWVFEEACRQLHDWRAAGIAVPPMTINLSASQLKVGDQLVREVSEILAHYAIAPECIELDIRETSLPGMNPSQASTLEDLRGLGLRIAIDDFGSELSSLGYVRKYRAAHLKIGRSIVGMAASDASSAATVRAIADFAGDLGIGVIVEGVETKDQQATLMALAPRTSAQGFLFSRPLSGAAAIEVLRRKVIAAIEDQVALEEEVVGARL